MNVLLVIHLILAVALVFVVLLQRTAQDGGGLMGGGSTMGGLFTARGSANLLTRTTAFLATAFLLTSLLLGIMAGQHHKERNITDKIAPLAPAEAPAAVPDATKNQTEIPQPSGVPQVPVSK